MVNEGPSHGCVDRGTHVSSNDQPGPIQWRRLPEQRFQLHRTQAIRACLAEAAIVWGHPGLYEHGVPG
jgi:hypothetical protein